LFKIGQTNHHHHWTTTTGPERLSLADKSRFKKRLLSAKERRLLISSIWHQMTGKGQNDITIELAVVENVVKAKISITFG